MHLGKGSKKGPIHSKITNKIKQEITLANCVFPPTASCIKDLLKDADTGIQEKNDPKIFPLPCNKFIL